MAKILICVPSGDMVAAGFAQSLAMLQKGGNETAIMFQVGSLIYDARNKLAKEAIKRGDLTHEQISVVLNLPLAFVEELARAQIVQS